MVADTLLPLRATDLHVTRRGKRLLGPVDLTLSPTGITLVLGPNGAGKTTLLKALHGLERLNKGTLDWHCDAGAARHHQAFVFQTPVMLRRSVGQNLSYPLELAGTARTEARTRVEEWASRIGLADALGRPATRLSGGERQKLSLARALITAPQLLFLDEPCTNLDGRATREIEALLAAANSDGTRIVMATHDLGQARRMADDVIFLLDGKIHEQGAADSLFEGPRTEALKAFLKGDIVE
jgi:tungstate transport system ATP-binding protein